MCGEINVLVLSKSMCNFSIKKITTTISFGLSNRIFPVLNSVS